MKAIIQVLDIEKGLAQVRVELSRDKENHAYGLFIPHSSSAYVFQIKASTKQGHELFIKHYGNQYFEINFNHPDFSSAELDFVLEYQLVSTSVRTQSLLLKMNDFIIRPIEKNNIFFVEVRFPKIFHTIHSLMNDVSQVASHFEFLHKNISDFYTSVIVIGNHDGDGFYFESTSKEKGTVLLNYDSIHFEAQKNIKEKLKKVFAHPLFDDIKNRNKQFHLYFSDKLDAESIGAFHVLKSENYLFEFLMKIFNDSFMANRILLDCGELDRYVHLNNLLKRLKENVGIKFDDQVSKPRYPEIKCEKSLNHFQQFTIDWDTLLELESWYHYLSNQELDGDTTKLIQFFEKFLKR